MRVVREAQVICVELVEHSKSQSQSAIMMIVYQSMQRSAESTDNVTHYVTYDLWNFETFHKGEKREKERNLWSLEWCVIMS